MHQDLMHPSKPEFKNMVIACATEDNKNLREYLRENVYWEKIQLPRGEHRRPDLPGDVKILIDDRTDCL